MSGWPKYKDVVKERDQLRAERDRLLGVLKGDAYEWVKPGDTIRETDEWLDIGLNKWQQVSQFGGECLAAKFYRRKIV